MLTSILGIKLCQFICTFVWCFLLTANWLHSILKWPQSSPKSRIVSSTAICWSLCGTWPTISLTWCTPKVCQGHPPRWPSQICLNFFFHCAERFHERQKLLQRMQEAEVNDLSVHGDDLCDPCGDPQEESILSTITEQGIETAIQEVKRILDVTTVLMVNPLNPLSLLIFPPKFPPESPSYPEWFRHGAKIPEIGREVTEWIEWPEGQRTKHRELSVLVQLTKRRSLVRPGQKLFPSLWVIHTPSSCIAFSDQALLRSQLAPSLNSLIPGTRISLKCIKWVAEISRLQYLYDLWPLLSAAKSSQNEQQETLWQVAAHLARVVSLGSQRGSQQTPQPAPGRPFYPRSLSLHSALDDDHSLQYFYRDMTTLHIERSDASSMGESC